MSQGGRLGGAGGGLATPVTVPNGGTGQVSFPAHSVLLGEGTANISSVGPGASNTILMGAGAGSDPVFGSLVAGSNITLTPGAGTITISSSGGGGGGNLTFMDDNGTSAISSASIINLIGTAAQGIVVTGNGMNTVTVTASTATTAQMGVSQLATNAQAIAGTDANNTVTSAALAAKLGIQTAHGVMLGEGSTSALGVTTAGTTNTVLLGNTGADPSFGTVPNSALSNSSITLSNGNNITVTGSPVSLGGTATIGVSGTTAHAVQIGNAGGSLTSLGVGTNGQVLIGSTGADPVFGNITSSDSSITVTNGPGTLSLQVSGSGVGKTITGNTGPALSPTAGNWNIFGNATQGVSTSGLGSTLTITVATATQSQLGVIELASSAQAIAGTDASNAVTSTALAAKLGTQTAHGVMLGEGSTSALGVTAAGTTNTVLLGNTGADPSFGTVSNAALSNSSITLSNGNNITITGSPVSLGGTATINVSGTTNHAVQIGNAGGSLTSLANGTTNQILMANTGADPSWATLSANIQVFTANGTYTPTAGMVYCIIECVGGGGGGGGAQATGVGASAAGGGGGGGAYGRSVFSASTIGASKTVTIGAGASGGTGTSSGGNGNTTSVGTLISADGGDGGGGGSAETAFYSSGPGDGGRTSVSTILAWGGSGFSGVSMGGGPNSAVGGAGGNTIYGTGAGNNITNGSAAGGHGNLGGGGAGAANVASQLAATGGSGGNGLVVITEYII